MMEALEGFEEKIKYDIIGHSGDSPNISFVKRDKSPKNNKERLDVIRVSYIHIIIVFSYTNSQYIDRQCTHIPNIVGVVIIH